MDWWEDHYEDAKPPPERLEMRLVTTTRADDRGEYSLVELPVGYYLLDVYAPFCSTVAWREFRVSRDPITLDLGLECAVETGNQTGLPEKLIGRVLDPVGNRIADATVTVRDAFSTGQVAQMRTDVEGRYAIPVGVFASGSTMPTYYVVCARKSGYRPACRVRRWRRDDYVEAVLILEKSE
ncbi:MAG: carboxypeptidase-like regulatory domain-containing protein [Acidobacteriota bacterium]